MARQTEEVGRRAFLRWSLATLLATGVAKRTSGHETARTPAVSRDLVFRSRGVGLAGTLVLPESTVIPRLGIVLLHGAHPGERMQPLASLLANEGFAVLTYDRRGTGESGGDDPRDNVSAERLRLLADDAVAAVARLADELGAKTTVGIVGLSHAGWVAPLAAARARTIRFLGLWSGPVCTTSEELHFSAMAENDPDFGRAKSDVQIAEHMQSVKYRPDDVDPRKALSGVSVPGLWIFGGRDNSIPVDLSIERLQSLIEDGRSNFRYTVVAEDGHNLADSPAQEGFRYMISWLNELATSERDKPKP